MLSLPLVLILSAAPCFGSPLQKRVAAVKISGAAVNYGPDPYVPPACLTECTEYWQSYRWTLNDSYIPPTATLPAGAVLPTSPALPSGVYAGVEVGSFNVYVAPVCQGLCQKWASKDRGCLSKTSWVTSQDEIEACECSDPAYTPALSECASCVEQNPANSTIHYAFRTRVSSVNYACRDYVSVDVSTPHALQTASIHTEGGYSTIPSNIKTSSTTSLGASSTTAGPSKASGTSSSAVAASTSTTTGGAAGSRPTNSNLQTVLCETEEEIDMARAVRHEVFVVEEGYTIEHEHDDKDPDSDHILLLLNGKVVGTIRWFIPLNKLGRLALLKDARVEITASAELHAIGFYLKLGFTTDRVQFFESFIY
ncbi:acetyltransferase GNAT family [Pseudohyphozyma bogoriensis]|nr:acetyltransferase GNAT family [Pseudohyphozyma bogoriensis]